MKQRILFALGSDFLGKWLPVCVARAMPGVECRFVGKLWVDGTFARSEGWAYQALPWPRIERGPAAKRGRPSALQTLIEQEVDGFRPDAVVYLTAESIVGTLMDQVARDRGIPAIGMQTFFNRHAVLVNPWGQAWWKVLRDQEIEPTSKAAPLPTPIQRRTSRVRDPLKLQSMVWVGRGERFLRWATRSVLAEDTNRLLASARGSRWATRGGFPNIGTLDIGNEPPPAHVLVALHRPVLPETGSGWLDLIRFALAATPDDVPIILRPHPDERGSPVPDELIAQMRSRGVRLSRPGQGANLATLLSRARLVITINSAVGMQALQAGVPAWTLGPACYARPGMANPVDMDQAPGLRQMIATGSVLPPDTAAVQAFSRWIELEVSAPIPPLSTCVVPANDLANRIFACIDSQRVHSPGGTELNSVANHRFAER